jgi:hypothetical protein
MPGSLRLFLWNWPVQEQVRQEQVQHQAEEEQAQQEETILWPVQQAGAGAGGDDSDESFFSHEHKNCGQLIVHLLINVIFTFNK